jgi:hypothetical protein
MSKLSILEAHARHSGLIEWSRFLHAKLSVDLVMQCTSKTDIFQTLDDLPQGLHEHYDRAWHRATNDNRLNQTLPSHDFARLILAWLTLAQPKIGEPLLKTMYSLTSPDKAGNVCFADALSWCCGLVKLTQDDQEGIIISLVHLSAFQYFEQRRSSHFSGMNNSIVSICLDIIHARKAQVAPTFVEEEAMHVTHTIAL